MSVVPPALAALMRTQQGLVTTAQLADSGISEWTRRRLVRDGLLAPVHPGVLRSTLTDLDERSRCLAANLALPDLVISGPTAGRRYGLRRMPLGDIHGMVPRHGVRLDGVIVHASNALGPGDHRRVDGILLLTPTRLAPDLARFLSDADLESVIEQMIDRGLVTIPGLFAMARRLRGRGRDGIQRYLRCLNGRPAWQRPAGSEIELRFVAELTRRGLDLIRQYRVDLGDGVLVHLDAALPAARVAVEIDHVTWHGGRVDSLRDKQRDRRLLRQGWSTVRVTDDDVIHRFRHTVDEVESILRLRLAA